MVNNLEIDHCLKDQGSEREEEERETDESPGNPGCAPEGITMGLKETSKFISLILRHKPV